MTDAYTAYDPAIDAPKPHHAVYDYDSGPPVERGKFAIVEKPLTGYLGDGTDDFHGERFPKQDALDHGLASVERMLEAEQKSQGRILYAENWVYAPSIQKRCGRPSLPTLKLTRSLPSRPRFWAQRG